MRWLLFVSFVPLVLCTDRFFICNDAHLTAMPEGELETVDNQVAGKFVLAVHKPTPLTYSPGEPIEVTLASRNPSELHIKQFILVARAPCDTCQVLPPVGRWDVRPSELLAVTGQCSGAGEHTMTYEADWNNEMASVNFAWVAPESTTTTVEFVASVIANDGKVYSQIRSPFVTPYALSPAGQEQEGGPRYDPREFEEEDRTYGDEEEEEDFDREEEEESGPYEDPNEGERVEEEMREESLRRDMEGSEGRTDEDNGARAEEEMKRRQEDKRRQEMLDEDEESEAAWVRAKYEEIREMQEEFENELMEYEKDMAEEEKKRMEMIQWEIRDKEEHDRIVAEEGESNRTPKDKPEEEIGIKEEIIVIKESSAGTLTASVAMVTVAAILKFFF